MPNSSFHVSVFWSGWTRNAAGLDEATSSAQPEEILGRYDLVFAKARCALEAMAVGAAVVLCSSSGLGPMVTTGRLDQLRRLNFGRRSLREAIHPDAIEREIASYDAVDATEVS